MKTLHTIYTSFAKRLAVVLTFLMTISVGTSIAQDELVYTLTPASGSNNSYAGNCDITISGIKWNLTGNSTTQPWRIGGKSLTKVDRTLYSKTAISSDISKIEVTHGSASSITVNSFKLIISDAANSSGETIDVAFKANATTTIELPDGDYTNKYFKFIYNVTVTGSDNKYLQFSSAKFYKTSAPACSYTVTFNGNGNTGGSMSAQKFNCGEAQALTANAFTKTGHTFAGWNTEANGSGDSYSNQQSVPNLANNGETIPLFAQWTPNKYTVNFTASPNGYGTVSQSSIANVPYGTTVTSNSNEITINGTTVTANPAEKDANYSYSFNNWSDVPNTITGTCTITANFTRTERELTNYRTTCTTETSRYLTPKHRGDSGGRD